MTTPKRQFSSKGIRAPKWPEILKSGEGFFLEIALQMVEIWIGRDPMVCCFEKRCTVSKSQDLSQASFWDCVFM